MVGNFATEARRHGGFWYCFYFIIMLRVKENLVKGLDSIIFFEIY